MFAGGPVQSQKYDVGLFGIYRMFLSGLFSDVLCTSTFSRVLSCLPSAQYARLHHKECCAVAAVKACGDSYATGTAAAMFVKRAAVCEAWGRC